MNSGLHLLASTLGLFLVTSSAFAAAPTCTQTQLQQAMEDARTAVEKDQGFMMVYHCNVRGAVKAGIPLVTYNYTLQERTSPNDWYDGTQIAEVILDENCRYHHLDISDLPASGERESHHKAGRKTVCPH